jgi:hypothetical protein
VVHQTPFRAVHLSTINCTPQSRIISLLLERLAERQDAEAFMTVNNLDEHLSWLLQRAPLSPSIGSFTDASIIPDEDNIDPDNDILEINPIERFLHAGVTVSHDRDPGPGFNIALTGEQEGGALAEMGRLSFAPRSTNKPRMLSQIEPAKLNSLGSPQRQDGQSISREGSTLRLLENSESRLSLT